MSPVFSTRLRVAVIVIVALVLGVLGIAVCLQARALAAAKSTLASLEPDQIDVGFAQFMNLHHQQAVGMAQLMLDGRASAVAGPARVIASTQLVELGEMRGWLRLWTRPLIPPTRNMSWMLLADAPPDKELKEYLLDCERSPTGMPGLATDADMSLLLHLQGRARDLRFLTMMIAHHDGGIPMARFAAQHARLLVVRQLAGRMVLDQAEEVARLRLTLAALATAPE